MKSYTNITFYVTRHKKVIARNKQSIIRIAMIDVTPIVGLENNFRGHFRWTEVIF